MSRKMDEERLLENEYTDQDEYEDDYGKQDVSTMSDAGSDMAMMAANVADPMTLTWENVSVHGPPDKKPWYKRAKNYKPVEPKPILQNVSGAVKPGSVLGIIGASGSGKTVLLNVLTRRNLGKLVVEGDIRVNGRSIGSDISKISAYVQQQDVFIGTLKVKEHLWFQAQLRLDASFSDTERERRVNDVMVELGLKKRADTLIGIPGKLKTLSGGERRRLLFASEILTNPLILFCDEPTTGLDAFMAQSVIQILRNMAAKGRTILCTIHQPASEVYAMFDQLLLLADGRMAFMGSTKEVLPFFGSVGFPCAPNYNPADFFIHTLALVPGKEQEHYETVKRICDAFENSVYLEDVVEDVKGAREVRAMYSSQESFHKYNLRTDSEEDLEGEGYHRNRWVQFRVLFWRSWVQQFRDPVAFKSALLQFVIVGLFIGLIYLQQTYDQKGIQNIDGALFMMQMMVGFNILFSVLAVLPAEYPLFKREYQDRMYSVDMYYLSHVFTEIPCYVIILPLVFTSITYWMIGLVPTIDSFAVACSCLFTVALYSLGIAHLVSVSTASVTISLSLIPLIRNILSIFGGFFINTDSVPALLLPLEYLSAFFYSNEIMVVNQWKNVDGIICEYLEGNATSAGSNTRCLETGQEVISSLSFTQSHVLVDFLALLGIYFACEIIGIFVLFMRARKLRIS